MHEAPSVLSAWSNFYVIAGSSAAALTGLMFVVITLVAGDRARTSEEGISTFSSPTVLHFCVALLVAAILSAPWAALLPPAVMLGLTGLFGISYVVRVSFRTKRLTIYKPGVDDWIWYTVAPMIAYAAILAVAFLLPAFPGAALFALAGAEMVLIFLGIHNAWDVVTFIAIRPPDGPDSPSREKPKPQR